MNCFLHHDRAAVGICKSCGKGLCADCAVSLPDGLACPNACEERVALLNRIIDSNAKMISAAKVQVRSTGIFVLSMGVLFSLFGFLPLALTGNTSTLFMGVLGLCFIVYGLIRLLKKSQRYPSVEEQGRQR